MKYLFDTSSFPTTVLSLYNIFCCLSFITLRKINFTYARCFSLWKAFHNNSFLYSRLPPTKWNSVFWLFVYCIVHFVVSNIAYDVIFLLLVIIHSSEFPERNRFFILLWKGNHEFYNVLRKVSKHVTSISKPEERSTECEIICY
jgi:hypothetical protein